MPNGIKSEKAKEYIKKCFNVKDKYKSMSNEDIRKDLELKQNNFAVAMIDYEKDINFGSIIRHANAFGAKEVFYLSDKKKYDRRGAVGSYHYMDVNWCKNIQEFIELKNKYTFVSFELVDGATNLYEFDWPENPLIIIGSESEGVYKEILDVSDHIVYIPIDRGSIRSMNASTTASIAMYSYSAKYK